MERLRPGRPAGQSPEPGGQPDHDQRPARPATRRPRCAIRASGLRPPGSRSQESARAAPPRDPTWLWLCENTGLYCCAADWGLGFCQWLLDFMKNYELPAGLPLYTRRVPAAGPVLGPRCVALWECITATALRSRSHAKGFCPAATAGPVALPAAWSGSCCVPFLKKRREPGAADCHHFPQVR
jgi:hypothetical protein